MTGPAEDWPFSTVTISPLPREWRHRLLNLELFYLGCRQPVAPHERVRPANKLSRRTTT